MKALLREIVEENDTQHGKWFDIIINTLIIISLISFSFETLPNLNSHQIYILHLIDLVCMSIFTIEYALRVFVAENKLKYIFSFYGIIDVLTIVPFFGHFAIDLRSFRSFRIFRIFRTLNIIRYNRALHRFYIAAKIIKEEIILFLIVMSILMYISSTGIYYFEHTVQPELFKSIFHSFWWSIVTLSTVGYGDLYPITIGGKIFASMVIIIGIGIVTIPAGLVASALSKARKIEDKELKIKKEAQEHHHQ